MFTWLVGQLKENETNMQIHLTIISVLYCYCCCCCYYLILQSQLLLEKYFAACQCICLYAIIHNGPFGHGPENVMMMLCLWHKVLKVQSFVSSVIIQLQTYLATQIHVYEFVWCIQPLTHADALIQIHTYSYLEASFAFEETNAI